MKSRVLNLYRSISLLIGVPFIVAESAEFTPTLHHPNIAGITLFAENPDIVTPVGIAVAPDGRVFVQENHTHKRSASYNGPKKDRILVFEDTDGDGTSDKRSVFYEGHVFSTDLLFSPEGHLYFTTRWSIGRFLNASSLQSAEGEPEILVKCETEGDYPHNGVGGLAIDPANPDWMAFGFGENLGADYTFVGSDGSKLSGGGEGGSTYYCRIDGSQLKRVSTGHWNAFGMTYDLKGNLFSTDNDPSSTPPNRLLHIVQGADYGFEFRYGRTGRHPLVSWHGEIPGTLGMIGPLGEAACGVVPYDGGHLLTASWTDNRVDIHPLDKNGASFTAGREPFISGPDNFRPVHFSYSVDGKYLYFTDWVNLSYPVHGEGRVWRVEFKKPLDLKPRPRKPNERVSLQDSSEQLGSSDPYIRTQAIQVLTENPEALRALKLKSFSNSVARSHYAVALKRMDPIGEAGIIPQLLDDANEDVRYVGIKWIADERLSQFRSQLESQFERADLTRRGLMAVVAALARLSGGTGKEFSPSATLLELAEDTGKSSAIRALALRGVKVDHPRLTVEKLDTLASSEDVRLQREAIRSLVLHSDSSRESALSKIAADTSIRANLRADAIAGLASFAVEQSVLLQKLSKDRNNIVSSESIRTLASADLIQRELKTKPAPTDVSAWKEFVEAAPGEPNTYVGRRLFFHPRMGTCYNCHSMNGRGTEVGPDLSSIRDQGGIDQSWLLEHIINPNAEVAPYFRPQAITTRDGKSYMGLILGVEGQAQSYVGPDGKKFSIFKKDVKTRDEIPISLMPPGLLYTMTAREIRDLLAYLLQGE
ncbi:MAG: c-type cytochrome [Opitutaceae bacterium]|nr:c-type cytochrome [Opitutaceae bacterium]